MSSPQPYTNNPDQIIVTNAREIAVFNVPGENIDSKVVEEFGDEWVKFHRFDDHVIKQLGEEYFDIVSDKMVNKNTYAMDVGCGTGRWTKYLSSKVGFIEAVDPSDAIFAADKLLADVNNVRLTRCSIDSLPFADNSFDFVMAIGVLHHIPNTQRALTDCVKKVKPGGFFYVYLYYNLDTRGLLFKGVFYASNGLRNLVSRLPGKLKRAICDILALVLYMPIILIGRFLHLLGLKKIARALPLSSYQNRNFFVIRNDSLDRFGTRLEQRFSAKQIVAMMEEAGLNDIIISAGVPFHHAVGKRASH